MPDINENTCWGAIVRVREIEREVNGCEMVCMGRRMYSSEVEPV